MRKYTMGDFQAPTDKLKELTKYRIANREPGMMEPGAPLGGMGMEYSDDMEFYSQDPVSVHDLDDDQKQALSETLMMQKDATTASSTQTVSSAPVTSDDVAKATSSTTAVSGKKKLAIGGALALGVFFFLKRGDDY